jgi:hypothetical protein
LLFQEKEDWINAVGRAIVKHSRRYDAHLHSTFVKYWYLNFIKLDICAPDVLAPSVIFLAS